MKSLKNLEKVILICVIGIFTGVLIAFAAQFGAPTGVPEATVTFLPENTFVVLTLNTLGFTSASKDIGFTTDKITVLTTWGGTPPTNIASALLGSIDGTNFLTLKVNTMTVSPTMYYNTAGQRVRYVKGYYASRSSGNATSVLSMKVAAGGN
jgi:flagellar biosynthesis protein FliQ